jgi:RNA-directed DNA polymerase
LKLNPIIRGWRNYFEHGNSYKQFMQLDEYMWMKLWRQKYCRGKQRRYRDRVLKEFREWYKTSGLEFFYTSNKRRYAL